MNIQTARAGIALRTVQECLQAVMWNATVGLAPLVHSLPQGLTSVPLSDMPPSRLVLACKSTNADPLVRSFTRVTAALFRSPVHGRRQPAEGVSA